MLHEQNLDELVTKQFGLDLPPADLSEWQAVVDVIRAPTKSVTIGMVGKYTELTESYKSLNEALTHAGVKTDSRVQIRYLDAEKIERGDVSALSEVDAILVPGGFGNRGVEGKVLAAQFARENKVPYLGICLGMQVAVIDFSRNVAGIAGANSSEFDKSTDDPVIALITEWMNDNGETIIRSDDSDLGGTMRLGGQVFELQADSLAARVYGSTEVSERHRHRFEFNDNYANRLIAAGLIISGRSKDKNGLVEMIELPEHPWFIGCQFHPEYTSNPRDGHMLFTSFINAALSYQATHADESNGAGVNSSGETLASTGSVQ